MFGAGRIVVYHMSPTAEVRLVLETYRRAGIVQVVPWNTMTLNSNYVEDDDSEVHYFGQLAALNDCAYRSMSSSKFVLFTDMDEVVVPRDSSSASWIAMLDRATRDWLARDSSITGSLFPGTYMIRSVFFESNVERPAMQMSEWLPRDSKLETADNCLTAVQRDVFIQPYNVRSKYFVWSKTAVMIGVHFSYDFIDRTRVITVDVDERVALLHHYQSGWKPINRTEMLTDRWMVDRYGDNITRRIRAGRAT